MLPLAPEMRNSWVLRKGHVMHPNPIFHDADARKNLNFARERGFGVLAVSQPVFPLISHIPFLLNAAGDSIDLHLVRSNPIARLLAEPVQAVLAISGPDSYVSPDWYGVADQVPTWNYVAVHLKGVLEKRPSNELHALLDRQSAFYENRLLPKQPWKTEKMTPDVMEKMMRMILPCRMSVTRVDGTWKLGQNKTEAMRLSAADKAAQHGFGSETHIIAELMKTAR